MKKRGAPGRASRSDWERVLPIVSEIITHVLKHVNGEAADSDVTQTTGIQDRAQYVRDVVQSFETDSRNLTYIELGQELWSAAPPGNKRASLRRALVSAGAEGEKPYLAIHDWVRWVRESPNDVDVN